ncbi:MAG TPA: Rieske (2Fe-2S) protein [Ignavibacteriaceae bacterium]|nr:Rieske (2Fe-2S) protein [Ignavibacteriaceae bacterium]
MSSRREFLFNTISTITIAGVSGSLASILQSCAANPTGLNSYSGITKIAASPVDNKIELTIDSANPLSIIGGILLLVYNNGDNGVLLQRINTTEIKALTAVCTHQGCIVDLFSAEENNFGCPCHGSRFNLNGGVVQGPADSPLQSFSTTFENNYLTIFL